MITPAPTTHSQPPQTYPRRAHQHDVSITDITAIYIAVQEQKALGTSDGSSPSINVTFGDTAIAPLQLESNTANLIDASRQPQTANHVSTISPAEIR